MKLYTWIFCAIFGVLQVAESALGDTSYVTLYKFASNSQINEVNNGFGYSVSGAGDVNADGYADVVVGAFGDDTAGENAGSAQVFSGKDGSILFTFYGSGPQAQFGFSVSAAGDVNRDGFADVIVGARNGDAGGNVGTNEATGSAYVFSGKDGSTLYTFHGGSAGDYFGESVSGAGDVNGDGFADVIVGAFQDDANGEASGSAWIFSGKDGSIIYTLFGAAAGEGFGYSVSGAGDVNRDGFADVIVGAPRDSGAARVLSGRDGSLLFSFHGEGPSDQLGYSVSGAGDVNADGYADVVVGANFSGGNSSDASYARVFSGKDGGVIHSFVGGGFGNSVSAAGDVNGDGFGDVVVGTARLFSGREGRLLYTFRGDDPEKFVFSVSGAGDVNGDGFADVVVGKAGTNAPGGALVFGCNVFAAPTNIGLSIQSIPENARPDTFVGKLDSSDPNVEDTFTYSLVAGLGDGSNSAFMVVNNFLRARVSFDYETKPSYSVRIRSTDQSGLFVEKALEISILDRVTEGSADFNVLYELVGEQRVLPATDASFGSVVSHAGDVNRDGYADVVVGAPNSGAGSVWVFSGRDGAVLYRFNGEDAGLSFGHSVAGAGDVNGDGFADVVVGAIKSTNLTDSPASVQVFSGKDGAMLFAVSGDMPDRYGNDGAFGFAVAGAGDVNRDGFADIIVGAHNSCREYSADGYCDYAGRIKMFSGKDGAILHDIFGDPQSGAFGYSVAGAGDINNDGFADVVVSAVGDSEVRPARRGYVRALSGKDGSAIFTVEQQQIEQFFSDGMGISVAGVGDVNRDGYADVVAGAPWRCAQFSENSDCVVFSGNVSVFSGRDGGVLYSIPGPRAYNVEETSRAFEVFGVTVAGAGDVNGDGHPDIVVGALERIPDLSDREHDRLSDVVRVFSGRDGSVLHVVASRRVNPGGSEGSGGGNSVCSVSGGGDVNGDGLDDIIVGSANGLDNGYGYLFPYGSVRIFSDSCPNDSNKSLPGQCGCGIPDTDSDGDGVADCNDNEPPSSISLSVSAIPENAPGNTVVGTFSTSDPDVGDTFAYSLVSGAGDSDNLVFNILGGTLRASRSFDFEAKPSYSVRVRSTDQGGLFTEQIFGISVINQNELVSVTINGADSFTTPSQRSQITSLVIVTESALRNPLTAFSLTNTGLLSPSSTVLPPAQIAVKSSGSVYTLRFNSGAGVATRRGTGVRANSLADGTWVLSINDPALFGNSPFGDRFTHNFFRMFGDSDGDGDVDKIDAAAITKALLPVNYNAALDWDGNGSVTIAVDVAKFLFNLNKRRRVF